MTLPSRIIDQMRKDFESVARGPKAIMAIAAEKAHQELLQQMTSDLAALKEQLMQTLRLPLQELAERIESMPPKLKSAVLRMGQRGWFWAPDMAHYAPLHIAQAIEEGRTSEVDAELEVYFDKHRGEIAAYICGRFPHRATIIRAAFSAHERQEYALSVPVLLAQTDGISKEITNKNYFMKDGKKPRTARYVESLDVCQYTSAILSILTYSLPITENENERSAVDGQFNRHMILHGESVDYDTKPNSARAISLINYITYCHEAVEQFQKRTPASGSPQANA